MEHTYISVCIVDLLCLFCDRGRLRSSAVREKSWSWSWLKSLGLHKKSLIYITANNIVKCYNDFYNRQIIKFCV